MVSVDEVDRLIAQAIACCVLASGGVVVLMTEHDQCREYCTHGKQCDDAYEEVYWQWAPAFHLCS